MNRHEHRQRVKRKFTQVFDGDERYGIANLEILAEELKEWSKKKNSIRIYDFSNDRDMCPQQFMHYVYHNDSLFIAFKLALQRLASRREQMGIDGKMDRQILALTQPSYCHLAKDLLKLKYKLQGKKNDKENKSVTVVVAPADITAEVPEKADGTD